MRIAFIIAQVSAGGAERQASILCNHWAAHGHVVNLATLENVPDHYPLNSAIVRTRLRGQASKKRLLNLHRADHAALRAFLRDGNFDVVISFGDVTNIKTLAASLGQSCPLIVSERSIPAALRATRSWAPGMIFSFLRRLLYPVATVLVVQTKAMNRWARRGFIARRIEIIPNVVDGKQSFETVPKEPIILSVGRLSHEKGQDILLEGFSRVAEAFPDWVLRIVGDGPCKPTLEQRVRNLGLSERVVFVPPVQDVWREYGKAGLFVLPSRFEGFPNALIEAMHAGCAVISSDCPLAPREIITNGEDGLLFCNEDPQALAAAMNELLSDTAKRQQLGSAAKQSAMRFAPKVIMPLWDGLLQSVSSVGKVR